MSNFIELNLKEKKSQLHILTADLRHYPSETLECPNSLNYCIHCGVNHTVSPIAENGLCRSCNELNNYLNY
jgi:hypothetical protein